MSRETTTSHSTSDMTPRRWRAAKATLLTLRCANWALQRRAGDQEDIVAQAVHDKWLPGLQAITGPWTTTGDAAALQRLQQGGALVIANHQSMMDIPLLMSACGPVPRFTAKASIQRWPFLGAFLTAIGTCFIDRHAPRKAQAAMKAWGHKAAQHPRALIAGFPEGSRSQDGQVQAFKSGLFRVAAASGLPIVVVRITPETCTVEAKGVIAPDADANTLRELALQAMLSTGTTT